MRHKLFQKKNMKKLIPSSIILLVLFNLPSAAQQKSIDHENFFRFGAKAGVNSNKITGESYKDGFNYNFQFDGFMQFNLSNRFGI